MMTIMNIRKLYIPALALLIAASCSKGPGAENGAETGLRLTPMVSQAPGGPTRAVVTTTTFATGTTVGYMVIGSSDEEAQYAGLPHLPGYDKITSTHTSTTGTWSYNIDGAYAGYSVAGQKTYGDIDIFGFYPYNASVTYLNRTAIPYEIGVVSGATATATEAQASRDYMWATPVIDHTMSNTAVPMQFNHAMTCIRFNVRKMYVGPQIYVRTLKFSMDNGRTFSLGGTYDATVSVPTLTSDPTKEVSEITVTYDKSLPANNTGRYPFALIVPELKTTGPLDDAEMTVEFLFSDQENPGGLDFHEGTTYKFRLSDVQDAVNGDGLLAGRLYNVDVDLSNFVKYSGTPTVVFPDWDDTGNHENSEPIEM